MILPIIVLYVESTITVTRAGARAPATDTQDASLDNWPVSGRCRMPPDPIADLNLADMPRRG
jgi:hypothetical protein